MARGTQRLSADDLRRLVDSLPNGLIVIDREYRFVVANATYARMIGWRVDELIGRTGADVIGDELFETFIKPALDRVFAGDEVRLERPWRASDAQAWREGAPVATIRFHYVPQRDANDNIVGCIGMVIDATDDRCRESALVEQALHDPLTGALNRRGLQRLLTSLECHPESRQVVHSVCAIDLDGFKAVNDCHGHARGDELLVRVAETLSRAVRQSDSVVRLGGDEFVLVLQRCGPEAARRVAESVLEAIQGLRVEGDGDCPSGVGASIGVAQFRVSEGWESAIERADAGCYSVKESGGGAVRVVATAPEEAGGDAA